MKDWKIDIKKSSYVRTFAFLDHQTDERINFLSQLLKMNSKQYKIDVLSTKNECTVSFVIQKEMYKSAIDNTLNSIELMYKELIRGKKD